MLICAAAEPITPNSEAGNSTHVTAGSCPRQKSEETPPRISAQGLRGRNQGASGWVLARGRICLQAQAGVAESTSLRPKV